MAVVAVPIKSPSKEVAVTTPTLRLGVPVRPSASATVSLDVINPAPLVSWLVLVNDVVMYPAPLVSSLLLVGIVGVFVKLL